MHRLIYALAAVVGLAYIVGAWHIYEQDRHSRSEAGRSPWVGSFDHPESNLRHLREAFAAGDYSNDLEPFLEAARRKAPASYQSWFLTASYHDHRADAPELTEKAFSAAVTRFPANGRLRLGLSEWLLRPRSSLPYRSHLAPDQSTAAQLERREQALGHLRRALELEPELLQPAVALLSRFDVPLSDWSDYLPDDDATKREILAVLDRAPRFADRRPYLLSLMASDTLSTSLLKAMVSYSSHWEAHDIWTQAAQRWLEHAGREEAGTDLSEAAGMLAQSYIVRKRAPDALSAVRRGMKMLERRHLERTLGVDLLTRVGVLLFDHGEPDLSLGLFVEALELAPRDMRARVGLARIHHQRGERIEAIRQLRAVLELDPTNVQASELMARISVGGA